MSLTAFLWLLFATVGPLPLVWFGRRWWAARQLRRALWAREYRRRKFGGAIRKPGSDKAEVIKRNPRRTAANLEG